MPLHGKISAKIHMRKENREPWTRKFGSVVIK